MHGAHTTECTHTQRERERGGGGKNKSESKRESERERERGGGIEDCWRPKRPGPASDGDSVTRQTLRAGILSTMRAPPPEKPY